MYKLLIVAIMLFLAGCGGPKKFNLSDYLEERRELSARETPLHATPFDAGTLEMCLDAWTSHGVVTSVWDSLYALHDIKDVVFLLENGGYDFSGYCFYAIFKTSNGYCAASAEPGRAGNYSIVDISINAADVDTFVTVLEKQYDVFNSDSDFGRPMTMDADCVFFKLDYHGRQHRTVFYDIEGAKSATIKEMVQYIEAVFGDRWHLQREYRIIPNE